MAANQTIIDALAMMNRAGRLRRPNAGILAGIRDEYLEQNDGEENYATRFLGLVARLAASVDDGWVVVIQGRVWWTFMVYRKANRPGRNRHPHPMVIGRVRMRLVRDKEAYEWQGRKVGDWLPQDQRAVTSLVDLVAAREGGETDSWGKASMFVLDDVLLEE